MPEIGTLLAGIGVIALSVAGPLDALAHHWLWGHMVQHLAMISVAAPLLAIGLQPTLALLAGWMRSSVPARVRQPAIPAVVFLATLSCWHVPAAFDMAVRHDVVHAAEHLTLMATATWLWRTLIIVAHEGTSVVWLFLVTLPMTALGVAMTIARTPWYRTYAHATLADALQDQQMAGVLMWSFGGLAALIAGVAMFAIWLEWSEIGGQT